jgi:hypothetical protein
MGMIDQITPWYPLANLPDLPCGIEIQGEPEQVTVRAVYTFYGGARDLLLNIKAEVFGCFSELTSHTVAVPENYPMVPGPHGTSYIWPLMEVLNSSWLKFYRERLWMPEATYRHLRVVSDDGSFDALTAGEPFACWAPPRP